MVAIGRHPYLAIQINCLALYLMLFWAAVTVHLEISLALSAKSREVPRQKGADIFPLPLPSRDRVLEMREKSDCREVWLFLLVSGLKHAAMQTFEPSGIQSKILGFLRERVDRFLDQSFRIELFDWVSFLKTRSLSYTGEEVRSAKWTNWYHIAPALPRGCVGSIPALDLAEGGIHAYLSQPDLFLRPDWESSSVPSSRVMVSDEEWGDMARGMIEYNLCAIIPQSALVKAGGFCILNGLFGVEKGEQHEGVEVHRLIMNLVPSNTLFLPVRGDVDTLPLLPQMNALELQPSEELIISSEDIRAMFYMFALPPVWYPYLAFNRAVPGDLVPPGVEEPCFLCSKVLPMGFLKFGRYRAAFASELSPKGSGRPQQPTELFRNPT